MVDAAVALRGRKSLKGDSVISRCTAKTRHGRTHNCHLDRGVLT